MDTPKLSRSKRLVLTLLSRGDRTKRELSAEAQMSWASVVKTVQQLIDEGLIRCTGKDAKTHLKRGKDADLFGLRRDRPLAIGVDIEYRDTRIILTNLTGEIFHISTYKTPQISSPADILAYIEGVIDRFTAAHGLEMGSIEGIGIGKPGIGFPQTSGGDMEEEARRLAGLLSRRYRKTIRIETNTKAYVVFEKWINGEFGFDSFIFTSIRTGLGTGIIYRNELFNGTHGLAGEIGHMRVIPDGQACRCGNYGCLETVVNQAYLYGQYRAQVLNDPRAADDVDKEELHRGLEDLFTMAKGGNAEARTIVETAGRYLGDGLARAVTILDISDIILSGYFGPDGEVILESIRSVLDERTLPQLRCSLNYTPFDPLGHVKGAATLILKDFFIDIPTEGVEPLTGPDPAPA